MFYRSQKAKQKLLFANNSSFSYKEKSSNSAILAGRLPRPSLATDLV